MSLCVGLFAMFNYLGAVVLLVPASLVSAGVYRMAVSNRMGDPAVP